MRSHSPRSRIGLIRALDKSLLKNMARPRRRFSDAAPADAARFYISRAMHEAADAIDILIEKREEAHYAAAIKALISPCRLS